MKTFDVQGIELGVAAKRAFAFIANAAMLPRWTEAFAAVEDGRAVMRTPAGAVDVELAVAADAAAGTVDWQMTFPDGAVAKAFSRVTPLDVGRCIYTFVLLAPPAPLEALEGALEAQSQTLRRELGRLARMLDDGAN
jgi:hypothetical protein